MSEQRCRNPTDKARREQGRRSRLSQPPSSPQGRPGLRAHHHVDQEPAGVFAGPDQQIDAQQTSTVSTNLSARLTARRSKRRSLRPALFPPTPDSPRLHPTSSEASWQLAEGCRLHWKAWDDEFVIFDEGSGDTHLLDPLAAEFLKVLEESPGEVPGLARRTRSAARSCERPRSLRRACASWWGGSSP